MSDMRKTSMDDLPAILTLEQSADLLQVSVSTLRALIAEGVVPAFKLGPRLTRVYRDELIDAIEQSRIQGAEDGDTDRDG